MKPFFLFCFFAFTSSLCSEETSSSKEPTIEQISEAMGHLISKNLQSLGLHFDLQAVVKGLQDAVEGKASPLEEEDCLQAINALQEEQLHQLADDNLDQATAFLQENSQKKGVISVEQGKLQYRIERTGEGEKVAPYHNPVVRYQAKSLNGTPFTQGPVEEILSLEDALPGLQKGVIGMQEKEVRTLYIHPDLGTGKQDLQEPNSLLIIEIEVLKTDISRGAHTFSEELGQPRLLSQEEGLVEEPQAAVR